jgi:hypothetical protein
MHNHVEAKLPPNRHPPLSRHFHPALAILNPPRRLKQRALNPSPLPKKE